MLILDSSKNIQASAHQGSKDIQHDKSNLTRYNHLRLVAFKRNTPMFYQWPYEICETMLENMLSQKV